ncbi:Bifunctional inhibitor/lipid-transfer protein/seed storage 2S albumin superfamily protein [Forsythia ovata]|uniref:Bifunctional inhibitor/lipid-transfer protein/seed storage 2S albumin superfamily protein n=1 Tax=Forsythia ovata TaxID=205694 RepID=A0ABD1PIZ8_9LAMI
MASKGIEIGILFVTLVTTLSAGATAQSSCTSVLLSMTSCLSYISGSSTTPSSSCCSALANVVKTQPECLCSIVNGGGSSFGVNINQTRAIGLPGACKVQTPPVSRCSSVNGPAMSPVGSPEISPQESADVIPDSPISPTVGGSKTFPGSNTSSNGTDVENLLTHWHVVSYGGYLRRSGLIASE